MCNISILDPIDVYDVADFENGYNKIYLSNTLSKFSQKGDVVGSLRAISRNLSKEGVIYVTDHKQLEKTYDRITNTELPIFLIKT